MTKSPDPNHPTGEQLLAIQRKTLGPFLQGIKNVEERRKAAKTFDEHKVMDPLVQEDDASRYLGSLTPEERRPIDPLQVPGGLPESPESFTPEERAAAYRATIGARTPEELEDPALELLHHINDRSV